MWTDIDIEGVTVRRGRSELDVTGVFLRVHWDDTASPQIMVQDYKAGHHELDTSDPWLAEVAAAVRRKIHTPALTARIYEEVVEDRIGKREAANENARQFQAAE